MFTKRTIATGIAATVLTVPAMLATPLAANAANTIMFPSHMQTFKVNQQPRTVNRRNLTLKRGKPVIAFGREHLSCKAWGAPAEFPSSLLLTNDGQRPIFGGERIQWTMVYNHNLRGSYTIKKTLSVGGSVSIPGVRSGTGRGARCIVAFVH